MKKLLKTLAVMVIIIISAFVILVPFQLLYNYLEKQLSELGCLIVLGLFILVIVYLGARLIINNNDK